MEIESSQQTRAGRMNKRRLAFPEASVGAKNTQIEPSQCNVRKNIIRFFKYLLHDKSFPSFRTQIPSEEYKFLDQFAWILNIDDKDLSFN